MKWIGIDKQDPQQRKFEFDDELILTSNPPQYSIRFLDTNDTSSIVCDKVFKLKPVKPIKRQQNKPSVKMYTDVPPMEKPVLEGFDDETKEDILGELTPKWGDGKLVMPDVQPEKLKRQEKKDLSVSKIESGTETYIVTPDPKNTSVKIDMSAISDMVKTEQNHKYEYKTILDDFDDTDSLEKKLNKLGEEMWQMVNFNIIQSMFPNKSRLFCILKRKKQ